MCEKYPHKLVLGVDARDGFVATDGWLDVSQVTASEIVADFREAPLAAVVYTDIATDGMLSGPNIHSLRELRKFVTAPLIASGGIHSVEDIQHLVEVPVDGCIVGKAFYEGRLSMEDALAAAEAGLG
jgi:phosphoribosylformimino-5-aminoimidazole carboxamide ribotide isomerase